MPELEPLLRRLAELQPYLCSQLEPNQYQVMIDDLPFNASCSLDPRTRQQTLAYVQRAIEKALFPELEFGLQKTTWQWTGTLLDTQMNMRFSQSDPEAAIAALATYLDWLEFGTQPLTGDES